jgi:DNA polymerase III epsilon subunit-like protein
MTKYILFDTETTGKDEEDRIIQAGAMVISSKGDVEVFDELCSAVLPIKIEAMAVHGITPDMIENKPNFEQTKFYKMLQVLNDEKNFIIAHNIPFDMKMLQKEGFINKMKIIDTLRVAKHLLKDTSSHALQYLRYYLKLYKDESKEAKKHNITIKPHDAIGDVLVMKLLLSHLVALVKKNFPDTNPMLKMQEMTKTPIFIEIFKFGKYKGRKIVDICDEDMGYINWMLDKMDLDEDMKYTLDKTMGHI